MSAAAKASASTKKETAVSSVKSAAATAAMKEEARRAFEQAYFVQTAAAACCGVYRDKEAASFDLLRERGWQLDPPLSLAGAKAQPHLLIGRKYFAKLDRYFYVVAFKGSTTFKDWKLDLSTKQVTYGGSTLAEMTKIAKETETGKETPAVHGGFDAYVQTVLARVVLDEKENFTGIFKEAAERENAYLLLCGHSLGGAAATLLGQRLLDLGFPQKRLGVVSFGAPAVGNAAFASLYGKRLQLLRVVNDLDPIPGSLQTFFGGYRQFGELKEYKISAREADYQHPMAVYFDYGMVDFYKAVGQAAAAGALEPPPRQRTAAGEATVAVWVVTAPALEKRPLGAYLKHFVTDEYRSLLPYYIFMGEDLSEDERQRPLLQLSKEAGADYMLVCAVDAKQAPDANYWYVSLQQALFSTEGSLITMGFYGRKVEANVGQFQAAGLAFSEAAGDLYTALPSVFARREETYSPA